MVKEDFSGAVEFQQNLTGSAGEEEGQPRQEKLLSKGYHGAFQVVLAVKNPPANAGDIRDVGSQRGTITRQSGWLLSKSLQAIYAGEDVEKRELSYTVGGNAN